MERASSLNKIVYLKTAALAIVLSISFILGIVISGYGANQNVVITINNDGVVSVHMNISVNRGLNHILLPVKPIPETINVYEGGKDIIPIYSNMTLIIPVEKAGVADIKYVANATAVGGKAVFEVGAANVILRVMKGVILLSLPDNVSEVHTEDGVLVLSFTGPCEISYTLSEVSKSKNISTITPMFPLQYLLPILAVIIVVIIIYLFISRRPRDLDSVDRDILELLRRKGGKALQTELMTELRIPKTTLWRHVKRLEELGYIEVEKIGRVNIVKLRRR